MEHPRWGAILGVFATKHITAGEELFAHYGYSHGHGVPSDYPWYWELKWNTEKQERMKVSRSKTRNKLS